MLSQKHNRGGVFTASREALHDAQQHQGDRGPKPHLLVSGQDCHGHRGERHGHHREGEGLAAAHPIADAAQHHTSEGANQKAGSKGSECRDQRGVGITGWKELIAEDANEVAVEGEVVPLHDIANQASQDHAPERWLMGSHGGLPASAHQ